MAMILLVEDEKLLRWSLRQRLEKAGHTVVDAENLEIATDHLRQQRPAIMLLDLSLPDGNGLDFYEANLDRLEDTVVLVMTAVGQVEDAVRAMKLGALDLLCGGPRSCCSSSTVAAVPLGPAGPRPPAAVNASSRSTSSPTPRTPAHHRSPATSPSDIFNPHHRRKRDRQERRRALHPRHVGAQGPAAARGQLRRHSRAAPGE
jgi:DNA-binding NarL/FixJ family response regulator